MRCYLTVFVTFALCSIHSQQRRFDPCNDITALPPFVNELVFNYGADIEGWLSNAITSTVALHGYDLNKFSRRLPGLGGTQ